MAIPKIIHYVWVGGQEKPKNIRLCMKSWQKHLKDYKIIEWNESNFDINSNRFVKQAYAVSYTHLDVYKRQTCISHR